MSELIFQDFSLSNFKNCPLFTQMMVLKDKIRIILIP